MLYSNMPRTKYNRQFYRDQSPEWKARKIKKQNERRRKWLESLKNRPCDRCHTIYPTFVLDWHHRNPANKLFGLGRGGWTYSKQSILDEIAKCDLLCANCHRYIEYA